MDCTPQELRQLIAQFAGGTDKRFLHSMNRRMTYSEGVQALAVKAGAYWFLDWVAFNAVAAYAKAWMKRETSVGILTLTVGDDRKGEITLSLNDNAPMAVTFQLDYTDFPPGEWKFYLNTDEDHEGYLTNMYLPCEH